MKFVLALVAAVVVLAALCQEGETAITLTVHERRGLGDLPQGDCTCEDCECKSRFICAMENIVSYHSCPGSYIYVCCRNTPAA